MYLRAVDRPRAIPTRLSFMSFKLALEKLRWEGLEGKES